MLVKHMLEAHCGLEPARVSDGFQRFPVSRFTNSMKPVCRTATCLQNLSGRPLLCERRSNSCSDPGRFLSDQTQAPLKLVDFGLELKARPPADAETRLTRRDMLRTIRQVCMEEWTPASGHGELLSHGEARCTQFFKVSLQAPERPQYTRPRKILRGQRHAMPAAANQCSSIVGL